MRFPSDEDMKEHRSALLEDAVTALERVRLRAFEAGAPEVVQITHSIAELLQALLRR